MLFGLKLPVMKTSSFLLVSEVSLLPGSQLKKSASDSFLTFQFITGCFITAQTWSLVWVDLVALRYYMAPISALWLFFLMLLMEARHNFRTADLHKLSQTVPEKQGTEPMMLLLAPWFAESLGRTQILEKSAHV